MTVAFLSKKGGVAKSTLSSSIAQVLEQVRDENSTYINLDTDQDYRRDYLPASIPFHTITENQLNLKIGDIIKNDGTKHCMIDTGGFIDSRFEDEINLKHIDVLVFPTAQDKGSVQMLIQMLKQYKDIIPTKTCAIIVSRLKDQKQYDKVTDLIEQYMKEADIDPTHIKLYGVQRSEVVEYINEGTTLSELLSKPNYKIYLKFFEKILDIYEDIEKRNKGSK